MSIRLLTDELLSRGYQLRELGTRPRYLEFTAPNGWKWTTKLGTVQYPFVSISTWQIAGNKNLANQLAAIGGASVPKTLMMPAQEAELDEFLQTYAPLVVKPHNSFGSHGMQLNITTTEQLETAITDAYNYSKTVLVQQQFIGQEVRFMVLRGEVVHCLLRETPQVVGDGNSSVAQLIGIENEIRRSLNSDLVPYPNLDADLIPERFLDDNTVPALGEVVEFGKGTIVGVGGTMRNITGQVHDSYVSIARGLAALLSPDFMAVDMLISDYRLPATAENHVFLEYSVAPSLRLYYDVRSGEDFDIAKALVNMIDELSQRT